MQCLVDGEPMVGRPKASTLKTEDGAEQGNGSPKKKKHKVVSKETIEESEAKSKAEVDEANKRFETKWMHTLWGISSEMRLMHKAQEKMANECTKIAEHVAYIVSNLDLVVEGKWYMHICLHGPVDGETELPPLGAEGPKARAEDSRVEGYSRRGSRG